MEPGVNVFLGANGHGKTNLLESVAMLALSTSPRARRGVELVGPAAAAWRIEQRNSLLKRIAAGEAGVDELDVWNAELVRVGTEVVDARAGAVNELAPEAAWRHAEIGAGERLQIEYLGPPEDMAAAVHNSLAEDLRRGTTSIGPHRDDLRVLLGCQDARGYGSQGQQRTAVVSLKLAEAELVARRTGERPVLLLDDVLSELDLERRVALLRHVGGGGQVVITSVDV